MKYIRKTTRPLSYPPKVMRAAVALANMTSIHHASRETGISTFTIRRHLILQGFTPKPRGCGIQHDNGRGLAASFKAGKGKEAGA